VTKPAAPAEAPIPLLTDVLVRVGGTDEAPELRRGIPTKVHSATSVSLMVLMDGTRDHALPDLPGECGRGHPGIRWCSSMTRGSGVGQWRLGGEA